jgi:hypothetical protein
MEELYKEIREMGEGKPGHEALKSRVGKHICEQYSSNADAKEVHE